MIQFEFKKLSLRFMQFIHCQCEHILNLNSFGFLRGIGTPNRGTDDDRKG